MSIESWLSRLFGKPEEISGRGICPTYLFRWTILKLFGCGIYIHKFVGDDWSNDLHDHPRRFITVGLRGSYREWMQQGISKVYHSPWIRSFPANHTHRLELFDPDIPCWTLVFVLKTSRPWGFWHNQRWIPWKEYVRSDAAIEASSCID